MSDFGDIATFYNQYRHGDGKGEIKNPYPETGLAYTCNCGWIDAGHAKPKGASNLWRDILNESDGYKQSGMEGYKIRYAQNAAAWGVTFNHSGDYFIKSGLSNTDKEQVALAIFQEVSLGFETSQAAGFKGFISETFGTGSSFSAEDLVSNLVGFYQAVRGTRWQDWCGIASREAAENIWKKGGTVGAAKNKNNTFQPKFHSCDECSASPTLPFVFQTIQPIEKGIRHFDFDASQALPIVSSWQRDFQNRLFYGNPSLGFGFVEVPRQIELVVKQDESQYFFARRALMQAAFLSKLPFHEQLEFTEAFYPLNQSLQNSSRYKMYVGNDPLKTDKNKDGRWDANEFKKLNGTKFTYNLTDEEYKDLKARRSNYGFKRPLNRLLTY